MVRYLVFLVIALSFLTSCEDTNLFILTDAGIDAVNAVTLSDEDVRSIASQASVAVDLKHRLADESSPYERRLRKLLAGFEERDGFNFDVKVYLTPEVNAFAMADGTIRVYSGLMDLMNDQELLFVVGHEMGHVVKKHSRKKVVIAYASSAIRKSIASQQNEIGQIARSVIGAFTEQLANAQFSQHEERQADNYGARFLEEEGYSVDAAVSALMKLDTLAQQHTFLSSHPDPAARARRLSSGAYLEDEDQGDSDSILASLVGYVKKFLLFILRIIQHIISFFF